MIQTKTRPDNMEFFSRLAPIIPNIVWGGIAFQVISAISEGLGIYTLGRMMGADAMWCVIACVLIVAGWEWIIRASAIHTAKTIAQHGKKKVRIKGIELAILLIVFLIGASLTAFSYFVSKKNTSIAILVNQPNQDTTVISGVAQLKAANLSKIESDFGGRKRDIEKIASDKINAAKGIYTAAMNAANEKISQYKAREGNYKSAINREKDKINKAYAVFKAAEQKIIDNKSESLLELEKLRTERENGVISYSSDVVSKENSKQGLIDEFFNLSSPAWSTFAGLSVLLAICCIVITALFEVEAGIEKETHLTPESLEPGLWDEVMYLLQLKVTSPIRNAVRRSINSTASKRVPLEIVTPSSATVTHAPYTGPTVTPRAEAVTRPVRPAPITAPKPVTPPVTETRYAPTMERRSSELPTHVMPVTPDPVTYFEGVAVPKFEPVTESEARVVDLSPTVTGKKPKKIEKPDDSSTPQIFMVTATKAVIVDQQGKKETITLEKVQNRKRANFGNIEKRKTETAKGNARRMYEFYADLEERMKEAK